MVFTHLSLYWLPKKLNPQSNSKIVASMYFLLLCFMKKLEYISLLGLAKYVFFTLVLVLVNCYLGLGSSTKKKKKKKREIFNDL